MQASLLSGDGKQICFQVLGACPPTGISSGTIPFPKVKPVNAVAPTHSGNLVDVLHLSEYVSHWQQLVSRKSWRIPY